MATWHIRSEELRRRRIKKMMHQTELSRLSGISLRAIRKLEAGDVPVTASTLDCLAKALDCKREDIGTYDDAPRKRASNGKHVPPPTTTAAGASDRPRMSELRAIEETLPPGVELVIDGERIPKLTVLKYQQCFTAYLARDGERYWIEGHVTDERGLPPPEAKLIRAVSGEAGRFEMRYLVGADGHVLVVTVHTPTGALTIAMQDAREKKTAVRGIVRLVALRDLAPGAGLASFARERPSPWGLVVERLIEIAAQSARAPKTKRARA
jgi:DNA-binding Xre family transcriptional regulator